MGKLTSFRARGNFNNRLYLAPQGPGNLIGNSTHCRFAIVSGLDFRIFCATLTINLVRIPCQANQPYIRKTRSLRQEFFVPEILAHRGNFWYYHDM
jgi:hypothetical protein